MVVALSVTPLRFSVPSGTTENVKMTQKLQGVLFHLFKCIIT